MGNQKDRMTSAIETEAGQTSEALYSGSGETREEISIGEGHQDTTKKLSEIYSKK